MKPITGVIIFFFLPFSMLAQTVSSKSDTSTTKRIIVYESYQGHKKETSILRNCLAINPLGILVGDFPIFYERNVKGKFHLLLGAGVTYNNYMYDLLGMDTDFTKNTNAGFNSELNREAKLGYSIMVQPKVYINDVDFEGLYFSLAYRYRNYNYFSDAYNGEPIPGGVKEYRNISDFLFNIGYSYNLGSDFIVDYYAGIGIRKINYQYADITPDYTGNTTTNQVYIQHEITDSPTAVMGFRLGYAF